MFVCVCVRAYVCTCVCKCVHVHPCVCVCEHNYTCVSNVIYRIWTMHLHLAFTPISPPTSIHSTYIVLTPLMYFYYKWLRPADFIPTIKFKESKRINGREYKYIQIGTSVSLFIPRHIHIHISTTTTWWTCT